MIISDSETLFADYLSEQGFEYDRNYSVANGDVDFRIEKGNSIVLCDVKEVRDSKKDTCGKLDAGGHIRHDIRKLREKFKKGRPDQPVVLVTMNCSTNFFTGLTVATALLGDIGIDFDKNTLSFTSPLHHLRKGNAVLTKIHNCTISGVFVFDIESCKHYLFRSPFTDHAVPSEFFPQVRVVDLSRETQGRELTELSNIMFRNTKWKDEA
jgi:Holliday junction resolvase-like predicted endonuclease